MDRSRKAVGLDLRLNLSPPRGYQEVESPRRSSTPSSPPSSCISMENIGEYEDPEVQDTQMVLVGCQGCLMYVILSAENPKCPKCKSTVLLDFVHEENTFKKCRKN